MFGNTQIQTRARARKTTAVTTNTVRTTAYKTRGTAKTNDENSAPVMKPTAGKPLSNANTADVRTTKRVKKALGPAKVNIPQAENATKGGKIEKKVLGPISVNTANTKPAKAPLAEKAAVNIPRPRHTRSSTQLQKEQKAEVEHVKPSHEMEQEDEVLPAAKKSKVSTEEEAKIEAKPVKEPKDWDDLDEEDMDDPLMVSEYVNDIFEYMKQLEIETRPNPQYMTEVQKELKWKMRVILIDWLIEVHSKFRLTPETLFLTVNIIDRFLSLRTVALPKLQLVGITAMFIASKYEEITHPSMSNFNYVADGGYTEEEIMKAERYVLQVLNFSLQYPNPMNFLRRNSKAENYDVQTRTLAKYLMEICLLDNRFLQYLPSQIAAAALYLSRVMLKRGGWTANLRHYSSYSEEEIIPISDLILDSLSKPTKQEALFKKYSTKKFMKASIFVKDWVKEREQKEKEAKEAEEKPKQQKVERRTSRRLEDLKNRQREENKEN